MLPHIARLPLSGTKSEVQQGEQEQAAAPHYTQEQIDRHFQRTDKQTSAIAKYNRDSRIYGYWTAMNGRLGKSEIIERMDAARRTGLTESLLLIDGDKRPAEQRRAGQRA